MTPRLIMSLFAVLAPFTPVVADTVVYREGDTNPFVTGAYTGASDTTLLGSGGATAQNTNFGAHDKLLVGIHDRLRRTLLRFDLTSMQGTYASITQATLTLTVDQSTHAGTLNVFQLVDENAGWVEGGGGATGTLATAADGEATWANLAHPDTGWTGGAGVGAGGFVATPVDSVAFSAQAAGAATPATLEITLPASLIEAWITGTNAGLLLKHASDGGTVRELLQLRSSESATISSRPTLTIQFQPIPEPASVGLVLAGLAVIAGRGTRH